MFYPHHPHQPQSSHHPKYVTLLTHMEQASLELSTGLLIDTDQAVCSSN
jgi:hypothetical protein